jgi:hypothetical protein
LRFSVPPMVIFDRLGLGLVHRSFALTLCSRGLRIE